MPTLEHLISDAVRDLPPRRAPAGLEALVMQEIQRRLSLPWWRMSFAHWPAPARWCFIAASGALIAMVARFCGWMIGGAPTEAALAGAATSVHIPGVTSLKAMFSTAFALIDSLPPVWLYGGITVIAATYVALFGIGAAAYRTLYVGR